MDSSPSVSEQSPTQFLNTRALKREVSWFLGLFGEKRSVGIDLDHKVYTFVNRFRNDADRIVSALAGSMESDDDPYKRSIAAALITTCVTSKWAADKRGILKKAVAWVEQTLKSKSPLSARVKCKICGILAMGDVPRELAPVLLRLIDDVNAAVQLTSAWTLTRIKTPTVPHIKVLTAHLKGPYPLKAAGAAVALLHFGIRVEECNETLLGLVPHMSETLAGIMIRCLGATGKTATVMIPILRAIASCDKLSPQLRGITIVTLAAISIYDAADIVHDALNSDNVDLQASALRALCHFSELPVEIDAKLFELADSENPRLREDAARAMCACPAIRSRNAPILLTMAAIETDADVLKELINALALGGPSVMSLLVDALCGDNVLKQSAVLKVVHAQGANGVNAFIEEAAKRNAPDLTLYVAALLSVLGTQSSRAVPVITDALAKEDDPDMQCCYLQALAKVAAHAASSARVVMRLCESSDPAVAAEAALVLRSIGSPALEALEEALRGARGRSKERYAAIIAQMRPLAPSRFGPLEHVNRTVLMRFVIVGRYLEAGAMGYRRMAKQIVTDGTWDQDIGLSENAICNAVKEVEKALGWGKLTTRKNRAKGGLSKEGSKALDGARQLLAQENAQLRVDKTHRP